MGNAIQQLPSGNNNQYQLVQNAQTRKFAFQSTGVLGYVPDKVTNGNVVTRSPLSGQYGFNPSIATGYAVQNGRFPQIPLSYNLKQVY